MPNQKNSSSESYPVSLILSLVLSYLLILTISFTLIACVTKKYIAKSAIPNEENLTTWYCEYILPLRGDYVFGSCKKKGEEVYQQFSVYLDFILAPTIDQPFGKESRYNITKKCLEALAKNEKASQENLKILTISNKRDYRALKGYLVCNETNIATQQVRSGLAWSTGKGNIYESLEVFAKDDNKMLWNKDFEKLVFKPIDWKNLTRQERIELLAQFESKKKEVELSSNKEEQSNWIVSFDGKTQEIKDSMFQLPTQEIHYDEAKKPLNKKSR